MPIEIEQARSLLSEVDRQSVDILVSLGSYDWFSQVGDGIQFYSRNQDRELMPIGEALPTEDFLTAIDFYCDNREYEVGVAAAMQKPNGVVRVYSPSVGVDREKQVVATIDNYKVPQILEFAYLILRTSQKES